MRLRHKPWASEELAKRPNIVIQQPEQHKGNWKNCFRAAQPLYVEVGTGKGKFLTGMAKRFPSINFIGVERYESVLLTAMERVEAEELTNVKLLNKDVAQLLDVFAENEVDRFFINFTDPWPKKKHAKRRLTNERFLTIYKQLLKQEGEVHFKTDNQGLFEYSLHSMSTFGMAFKNVSLNLHQSGMEENVMTEYEEKFSAKGMPIYRLEATFRQ